MAPKCSYFILLSSVIGLFLLIFVATCWTDSEANSTGLLIAFAARRFFSTLCHQIPSRSFCFFGETVPVCARCLGIYTGLLAGLVVYPFICRIEKSDYPARKYLVMAVTPTMIDFFLGFLHIVENTHLSRLLTAIPAGGGVVFYLMPAVVCLTSE
ncbi:MAG: DUF2085 domain-containing protein, partial [Blastocatellia bacterium]|nr:DUF2085 domain-containing protein [Blastocatellia bacterium]